jgi:hypothetical protein
MTSQHRWSLLIPTILLLSSCQPGGDVMDLSSLVPGSIGAWRADPQTADAVYDSDTVFDYMDGAGEVFRQYAYKQMFVRRLVDGSGDEMTVEVYDMGTPADAFGIFARFRSGEPAGIGQGSAWVTGQLNFWKGRFYVSVYTFQGRSESTDEILSAGRSIAEAIAETGPFPAVVRLLPVDDLVPETIRYFHTHTELNRHFFLADDDVLGLAGTAEAALAHFRREEEYAILLLVLYPEAGAATSAAESAHRVLMPESGATETVTMESGLTRGVTVADDLLAIVLEARSPEHARELLAVARAHREGAPR